MKVHYDFSGRTVLIAGAASGIGHAMAWACQQAGAQVVAGDIAGEGLSALRSAGMRTQQLDIAQTREVDDWIQDVHSAYGRLDAAILTSAIQRRVPVEDMTDLEWQRHLDVNLTGIFKLIRAIVPIMKRQQSGAIVTFTSGLAQSGWPGAGAYAATKAGLVGLIKSVAIELRHHGVRINAVSPGLVTTPVFLNSASVDELATYEKSLGVSTPEEVVPTLMHLISDGAAHISGNVVERRLIPRAKQG